SLHATSSPEIYTLSLHDALPISDRITRRFSICANNWSSSTIASRFIRSFKNRLRNPHQPLSAPIRSRRSRRRSRTRSCSVSESRSEEHTSELQSRVDLVCRLLLE